MIATVFNNSPSFFSLLLAACLVLALGLNGLLGVAWAKRPADRAGLSHHQVNWAALDLSAEQSRRLHHLENQWQQTYQQVSPQIRQDHQTLRSLLASPNPDEAQVMALQQRIHEHERQLRRKATQTYLHKRRVLSPEQRLQLKQMMP